MKADELASQFADALEGDWRSIARPNQLPPDGEWVIWLISAGRDWGKTRCGAEWVREQKQTVSRIALVGATAADARDVMVEGESGILEISPKWDRPDYEPSKRRLTWPNGAIATCFSAEEGDRLRGPQHGAAWCDELGAWRDADRAWDNLQFGLRLGKRPRVCVTTTPKPTKLIRGLVARAGGDVALTRGTTAENSENLAPGFLKTIVGRYAGTRVGRQELGGELLEDVEGALWARATIDELRRPPGRLPPLRRVVVAVDPAVSSHEGSDETGIIVAGLGEDGHGYVLEDGSGRYAPVEWARRAVHLYRTHFADRVVCETNQGGAMVETTLRTVDGAVPYRGVHAARGKVTRAEPISALYEQGRVHHVGEFAELEDQLCTFAPGSTTSPDRLDALVWALTELMGGGNNDGMILYYERLAAEATNPRPAKADATVRCTAPHPGAYYLITGRRIDVGLELVADLTPAEAKPLRAAGWTVPPLEEHHGL